MSEKLCPICGGKKIYSPSGEERGWLCNRCGSEFFGTDMNNTFWQQRIDELEVALLEIKNIVRNNSPISDRYSNKHIIIRIDQIAGKALEAKCTTKKS